MTATPLPPATALERWIAAALREAAPGENAAPAGGDWPAGAEIRAAGAALRPLDLPALAAWNIGAVAVRAPRVAVRAGPRAALLSLAPFARAEDAAPDLLLLPHDAALDTVIVPGLGAAPGEAARAGLRGGVPALCLPPRDEDAIAAFLWLGRPFLAARAGWRGDRAVTGRLAAPLPSRPGLAEWAALRLAEGRLHPLAPAGHLPLRALAAADALLLVPEASEGYDAGAEVRAMGL